MEIHDNIDNLPEFTNAVITIGSFDGVHKGHKTIFQRIKKLANKFNGESVVITFNPHPRSVIFPSDDSLQLLTLNHEKKEELSKLDIDHLVIVPFTVEFSQLLAEEYVENFIYEKFRPKCIVIGYDHRFGRNREGDVNLLRKYSKKYNFIVEEIEKQSVKEISVSSTKIRAAIKNGDIEYANELLGHAYAIIGTVEHGNQIGQQLGFPTANIKMPKSNKLLPPHGIYAALVEYGGKPYGAMMYYGSKPSIKGDEFPVLEVHIFDFNENIYGEELIVRFISFLRNDKSFEDLNQLRHQLRLDQVEAQKKLKEKNILRDSSKKSTAIILLNYNGLTHLENYLPDLVKYTPKENTEIWIVDNNSTDISLDWTEKSYPDVFTMKLNENYGYAGGYNRALEKIDADYFVILNNDVRVTENWLPPLIQRLESHPNIASVQPKIKSERNPDQFEYAGAAGGEMDKWGYPFCRGRIFDTIEADEGQYEDPEPIFWCSGAAMIIKSDLFLRAGGFDPSFFAHQEEIDLSWRLLRAGYRIYYEPKSVVYHLGGGTLSYNAPHKVYLNFRNNITTLIKNEPTVKCIWLLPLRFFLDTVAALKFLFDNNAPAAKSIFRAYGYIIGNMSQIIAKRRLSATRVRKIRTTKNNKSRVGSYRLKKSIVFQYFIRNKKTYRQLQNT